MDIRTQQNLTQTQQLIITPELKQALAILQLSSLELATYIEQAALINPLLEVTPPAKEINNRNFGSAYTSAEPFSTNLHLPTLHEHLQSQMNLLSVSSRDKKIANYIIGNINPAGYLTLSTEEIACNLAVSEIAVEQVLTLIQSFDPLGVGARDISECLLLQLAQNGEKTSLLETLLTYYLEDIAKHNYSKITSSLQITVKELHTQIEIIKTLQPKPGSAYPVHGDQINYISPDFTISKVEHEYAITYNDQTFPSLKINNTYKSILDDKQAHADTLQYLETMLNSAIFVINSIEQRRLTMMKIMNYLVVYQRDFFDSGLHQLKPMTLKLVADSIGMHESTISRATDNKYVLTPQGLFPLKYFFHSGLGETDDQRTSSEYVKSLIASFIKSEDKRKPYSDQKLANILNKQDISISRRTIAKYRELLQIPNTVKRKIYD